jgi:hypothetical protein
MENVKETKPSLEDESVVSSAFSFVFFDKVVVFVHVLPFEIPSVRLGAE